MINKWSYTDYERNRTARLNHSKQYYQDNKEERLEYQSNYYQTHKEERREYQKEYDRKKRDKKLNFINTMREMLRGENSGEVQ